MDMIVEINLETVVSYEGLDDAALLVAAEHFKNNCFEFIDKHRNSLKVKVFCELKE